MGANPRKYIACMSLLVFCPDRRTLQLLAQQVSQAGHRPICCTEADRLLETAREQLPDSILVVHDPPAADGIALVAHIQKTMIARSFWQPLIGTGSWQKRQLLQDMLLFSAFRQPGPLLLWPCLKPKQDIWSLTT